MYGFPPPTENHWVFWSKRQCRNYKRKIQHRKRLERGKVIAPLAPAGAIGIMDGMLIFTFTH